jgi:glycosyltransferase involved in cell wall biosynthesis
MNKQLTIVMPYLNENQEPVETIKSICSTSDIREVEIIAIDDYSDESLDLSQFTNVRQIRNSQRLGVDASRQLGIEMAQTDNILVIDAHMRFKQDNWSKKMNTLIRNNPQTLWSTVCLGLGYGTLDINNHKGKYFGANMLFIDKGASSKRPARECLECKWATEVTSQDEYEIPCILGANYFFSKKWMSYINGWNGLKSWGTSEPFVSLKSYMAGGNCKLTKSIEIGHVFRSNAPYATQVSHLVYNKIFLCKTILPLELGEKLINYLPKDANFRNAMKQIELDKDIIKEDRKYYESIFKYSIEDYCKKFNIGLP